jgi:hypothetical protein
MIKKCSVITLAVLLAFCVADARKRKPRSGKVVDNVYQDAGHGFGVTFPENWDPKTHKGDGIIRLTLVQKDFKPDSLFNRGWNEMTFKPLASHPLIELWIVQTQLEEEAFVCDHPADLHRRNLHGDKGGILQENQERFSERPVLEGHL